MKNYKEFRSHFEKQVADKLTELGLNWTYEPERIPYLTPTNNTFCADCNSKNIFTKRTYLPDFVLDNGLIIEAKGYFNADERRKALALSKQLPIIYVFSRNNKIRKTDMRYSDFCDKNEIRYCVGVDALKDYLGV